MVVYASSTVDVVFRISGYRVLGIGIVDSKSDGLQSSGRISKRFWMSYDEIVYFGSCMILTYTLFEKKFLKGILLINLLIFVDNTD